MKEYNMSRPEATGAISPVQETESGLGEKGLNKGVVGVLGAVVIGVSCIAPAYTLTAALGPTVAEVGTQLPAIFLAGFLPMLLVALGYRELNSAMPDSGTSFTWATRAFGPWIGWMGGWGLIAATIIVLSNLAAVAVDFFYILLAQLTGNEAIGELTKNLWVNIPTTLVFIAVACWISYRGMQTTKIFQYVLVAFQLIVLGWFAIAAFVHVNNGTAFDATPITLDWFNPMAVESFSAFAAGVSLSIFIFWGWDVTLTMNEETKDPDKVPGRAATHHRAGHHGHLHGRRPRRDLLRGHRRHRAWVRATRRTRNRSSRSSPARSWDRSRSSCPWRSSPPRPHRCSRRWFPRPAPSWPWATTRHCPSASATFPRASCPRRWPPSPPAARQPRSTSSPACCSENALWDTITALGLMICFYYGVTALACVWYFRRELFSSARNIVFKFLAPLVGGVILLVMFVSTARDSMSPDYGSGSNIGGLGMVFILGMGVLLLGVVIMVVMRVRQPGFFKGETLKRLK